MSGGHFDYQQYAITDVIDQVINDDHYSYIEDMKKFEKKYIEKLERQKDE